MGLICVCGATPAAGSTTLAVALAATMPGPATSVLVEASPWGGSLAQSLRTRPVPTLNHATAFRLADAGHAAEDLPWQLPSGSPAWLCPSSRDDAWSAVTMLCGGYLFDELRRDNIVVADLGHLTPSSPALPIARHADLVIVVARPHPDAVRHADEAIGRCRLPRGIPVTVVVRTDIRPGRRTRQTQNLEALDVVMMREDRFGARLVTTRAVPDLFWQQFPLAQDAGRLAVDTVYRIPTLVPPVHLATLMDATRVVGSSPRQPHPATAISRRIEQEPRLEDPGAGATRRKRSAAAGTAPDIRAPATGEYAMPARGPSVDPSNRSVHRQPGTVWHRLDVKGEQHGH